MDCTLWPLFVTARYFLEGDTIRFNGRSPSGIELPTGVRLHPFGNKTRLATISFWAKEKQERHKNVNRLKNFRMEFHFMKISVYIFLMALLFYYLLSFFLFLWPEVIISF